jgi:O-antigen/teichoic acid export membrane protein
METKEKGEVTHSLNALAKTSLIVLIGLGLSKVFTYLYRIIAARMYGPDAYGHFALATIIAGFFIAAATLGFSEGILRYVAIYRGQKKIAKANYLFRTSTGILLVTSMIMMLILFVFADKISISLFHDPNLTLFLQIFSLSIPLTVVATPLLMSIRAFERIAAYSGIYNILQNATKVAAILLFIFLGLGPQAISWSYIAGLGAVIFVSYIYSRRKIPELYSRERLERKNKKKIISEVFRYSWPLLFYSLLYTVLYWIDSFSIGYFKDATAVGLYNAAVPIALLITFAPELFTQLFVPMINKYYAERKGNLIKEVSKQMSKWILAVNLPIFVLFFAFPQVMINVLFGPEYIIASEALRILSISALFLSLGAAPANLVSMRGKSKIILLNVIIAAALNIILNSLLVPMPKIWFIDNSLGINGAALATVISMGVFNLLLFLQAHRYAKIIPLRRKMLNMVIAIIPSTIFAFYIKSTFDNLPMLSLILAGVVFLLLYALSLYILKAFDEHDREIIKRAFSKMESFAFFYKAK